jgi:hypothetical protein
MSDNPYNFEPEANETDKELTDCISKLGALSEAEIQELLPDRVNQDQLNSIIAAVDEATDDNKKRAVLLERLGQTTKVVKGVVEKFGGTGITVLL